MAVSLHGTSHLSLFVRDPLLYNRLSAPVTVVLKSSSANPLQTHIFIFLGPHVSSIHWLNVEHPVLVDTSTTRTKKDDSDRRYFVEIQILNHLENIQSSFPAILDKSNFCGFILHWCCAKITVMGLRPNVNYLSMSKERL